jgi:hypothetical protein
MKRQIFTFAFMIGFLILLLDSVFATEEKVILTPEPSPKPRINGARVFGVRPGSPFLFSISATGEQPMQFGVEHLPEGLQVDSRSGQITGVLHHAGEYSVILEATNRLGLARCPFKIVFGVALFRDGFDVYSRNSLYKYGGPGGWNDPDYLLLGYLSNWKGQTVPTPLTPNEQYTQVSLWCLLAAPLILSGDITRLDKFTLSLLTNDEVIEVDQDPLGRPGRRVAVSGPLEVWAKEMEDGSTVVGLFNRGERETEVVARWQDLSLQSPKTVRDLWRQQDLGQCDREFRSQVPRHGVRLVSIK